MRELPLAEELQQQVERYPRMAMQERQRLCWSLKDAVERLLRAAAAPPPAPPPAPPAAAAAAPPPMPAPAPAAARASPGRAEPAAPPSQPAAAAVSEPVAAAAAPAVAASDLAAEWELSRAEQKQRPFVPPPLTQLQRPVPVVFDLETTGEDIEAVSGWLAGLLSQGLTACLRRPDTAALPLFPADANPWTNHITELAALPPGAPNAALVSLVSLPAGATVSAGAAATNGITDEVLAAGGAPFPDVYRRFCRLLRDQVAAAGPGAYLLLVGHNLKGEWEKGRADSAGAGRATHAVACP